MFFLPKKWNKQVVIWINEEGKAGLLTADGAPRPDVQKLLSAGAAVCGVDLLFQGEFLPDGKPISHTRKVANPREFAGYTFGYNHSLFEQRVHDVLTVIGFCKHYKLKPDVIDLIALDGTGPIAAMALAQAGGIVRKAALDTHGFRFGKLTDFHDPMFMPGAAKYGDLPGILSLVAPVELQLAGETPDSAPLVAAAYRALGAEKNVSWQPAGAKPGAESAVSFVLGMSK